MLATDPFLDTDNKYELWRSKDRKSWIWLNSTSKEVVFLQDWNPQTKKHYALHFQGTGLSEDPGVSTYNF